MARTVQEVQQSLVSSLSTTDSSLDSSKGPIYDVMIAPVANEVSVIEQDAETLSQLYSLAFAETATSAQVQALATNYGIQQGLGGASIGTGYFMRYTAPKPTEQFTVSAGTLVSSADLTYVFSVVNTVTMVGANAATYFNPSRGTYEIQVQIQATATGPTYNLPALRINRIVTPVQGYNAFENRLPTQGGTAAESLTAEVARIQAALLGRDSGTVGGIASQVLNYAPGLISDVSIIQPTDRVLFTRPVDTPALDVYVIGENVLSQTETYVAVGGETIINPQLKPVSSVTSLTVNSVAVPFIFVQDVSTQYGYSAQSNDYIQLSTALNSGDVVVYVYNYDQVISNLQTNLFSNTRIFSTNILARQSIKVLISVSIGIKVLPSFDPTLVSTNVASTLATLIDPGTFISILQPTTVQQSIQSQVAGVQTVQVNQFTTTLGSVTNVQVITVQANQEPVVDQNNLQIILL